jgi:hypothetical protein
MFSGIFYNTNDYLTDSCVLRFDPLFRLVLGKYFKRRLHKCCNFEQSGHNKKKCFAALWYDRFVLLILAGLPDGIVSNQKYQFGEFLWAWKRLEYFMTIWNILRTFGIFCGHWAI